MRTKFETVMFGGVRRRVKRDSYEAPKTVMFGGVRRRVKRDSYCSSHFNSGVEITVLRLDGRYYAYIVDGSKVPRLGFGGMGATFEEAVRDLEAQTLKRFKILGRALNYDVER